MKHIKIIFLGIVLVMTTNTVSAQAFKAKAVQIGTAAELQSGSAKNRTIGALHQRAEKELELQQVQVDIPSVNVAAPAVPVVTLPSMSSVNATAGLQMLSGSSVSAAGAAASTGGIGVAAGGKRGANNGTGVASPGIGATNPGEGSFDKFMNFTPKQFEGYTGGVVPQPPYPTTSLQRKDTVGPMTSMPYIFFLLLAVGYGMVRRLKEVTERLSSLR